MGTPGASGRGGSGRREITGPSSFWDGNKIWTKSSGWMGCRLPNQVLVVAAKFSQGSCVLRWAPKTAKRLLGWKASQGYMQRWPAGGAGGHFWLFRGREISGHWVSRALPINAGVPKRTLDNTNLCLPNLAQGAPKLSLRCRVCTALVLMTTFIVSCYFVRDPKWFIYPFQRTFTVYQLGSGLRWEE